MVKARILVAEDDPISGRIIQETLNAHGYAVTLVTDGKEALSAFETKPFPLLISDLNMPCMHGHELIIKLKQAGYDPVIIVETSDNDSSTIIETMKMGIHDYILKPVKAEDILFKVERALEIAQLKKMEKAVEKERQLRLSKQLDWSILKEKMAARSAGKFDQTLFSSLKTSFSQGAGFGVLVSLLSLIAQTAKQEGNNYIISKDLMDLVLSNVHSAEQALQVITEIDEILNRKIEFELLSLSEFHREIEAITDEMREFAAIKTHTLQVSHDTFQKNNDKVRIHREYFKKSYRELLLNAMKYSEKETDILILLNSDNSFLHLSVLNIPDKTTGGILPEYERIIFEPFFRLVRTVDERYKTLDFGLGLTLAEKIILKHNGRIVASSISDHLNMGWSEVDRVNFEIILPLVKQA